MKIFYYYFLKICIIYHIFTFHHKINKSNTTVSTHYQIVCLYFINICYNIFLSYEFFNFFWHILNSKATKIYYIKRCYSVFTILIQSDPMSSCWFKLIKIYCICSILIVNYFLNAIKFRFAVIIHLYFKIS